MAQYMGTVQGNRGGASRLGSKNSGMDATARGWNIGGSVWVSYNEKEDRDEVTITLDGGSNGGMFKEILGTFYKDGEVFEKV